MNRNSLRSALRVLAHGFVAVAALLTLDASAGRLSGRNELQPLPPASSSATAGLIPKAAGGVVEVVEFHNATLDHYFISADPAEVAVLDGGAFGGAWKRTGSTFPAWDVVGSPSGTVPVCRFFGTDRYRADGSRIGPNSHFYTADPNECAFVKTAWQSVASDGISYPAWTFEANAFAVKLPVGGACPAGTQPLYRAYNNGARGDPNHRYSLSAGVLQAMAGWAFEGLVMCLPQAVDSVVLPPQLAACEPGDCPASTTPLGNGVGLVNVVVEIVNGTAAAQDLVVPAGTTFVSTSGTFQDGLAVDRLQATIAPGTTRKFVLRLFCMQATRAASHANSVYAPGPATTNAQLLDIVAIANGKLGSAGDPAGLKAESVQFAVWEVTDGRGALTPAQRTLLVSLLAAPATDLEAQVTLADQFLKSLSIVPGN